MSSVLKDLRREQARLEERKRQLSNQADKSLYVGLPLAIVGLALVSFPPLAGLVLGLAYSVTPAAVMTYASFQSSDEIEKIEEDLLLNDANIEAQEQYENDIEIIEEYNNQSEADQVAMANSLGQRQLDDAHRRFMAREFDRQIENRDHYDYVKPPSLDFNRSERFDDKPREVIS